MAKRKGISIGSLIWWIFIIGLLGGWTTVDSWISDNFPELREEVVHAAFSIKAEVSTKVREKLNESEAQKPIKVTVQINKTEDAREAKEPLPELNTSITFVELEKL